MSWLEAERTEVAAERILDAAGELFAAQGVGKPGMDEVARAAGCSRATLYRYFENRHALIHAFAHREARQIIEQVARATTTEEDPQRRAVEAVLACLAAVRERPALHAWYTGDATVLREVLHESALIQGIAATYLSDTTGAPDADLGDWVLRVIVSFLTDPGADAGQERRLLTRFLTLGLPAPRH